MNPTALTVYYDFLCPWAYRGAIWLDAVEKAGRIKPTWQFFSLMQNSATREGTHAEPVWKRDPKAKGLPAFLAATAAREQGEASGSRFRLALQRARHEDGLGVDLPATHLLAAQRAGLDIAHWEKNLRSASFDALAAEHNLAVRGGVFGVPTLVWPEGRSYYMKITELVPAERAVALYEAIETVHRFGEIIEIKTPESEGTIAA